jgi:hypothetical protein
VAGQERLVVSDSDLLERPEIRREFDINIVLIKFIAQSRF